jgi:hypothetical protein
MSNFALAVKYGIKDFFKRQTDIGGFIQKTKDAEKQYSRWSYDELCLVTVLAGIHTHSFGIPGSIIDAVKAGRWRYHDLKDIESRSDAIFAKTALSEDGKKQIHKMMKQGKHVSPQQFSQKDADILEEVFNELNIARGACINYP